MDNNTCLNIILRSDEYEIQNGSLLTLYSNRNFTDYRKENDSVHLCFPFSENFRRCLKWKFDSSELYYNYCSRNFIYNLTNSSYDLGNYYIKSDNSVFLCIPNDILPSTFDLDLFCACLWSLSLIGLLISFYCNVGNIKKSRIAQSLQCHITGLIFAYVLLFIRQGGIFSSLPDTWEMIFFYVKKVNLLSIYTWLNVMSFDTWRQFHPTRVMIQTSFSRKGFLLRCLYGYGLPLALTTIYFLIDNAQLKWSKSNNQILLYSQIVIGFFVMFITNMIFFCLIMINLKKAEESISLANLGVNRSLLNVYVKLTALSTINLGSFYVSYIWKPTNDLFWMFPFGVISLHGVAVFLLYALNSAINQCRKNCRGREMSNLSTQSKVNFHTEV